MLRNGEGHWRGIWNADKKIWGTTDREIAIKLLESQKWLPYGISDMFVWPIVDKLKAAVAEKNVKKRKWEEAVRKKEEREREREDIKKQKEAQREAEKKARATKKENAKGGDAAEAASDPRSFEAHIDENDIQEALRIGIPVHILKDCVNWNWLGPRCSTIIVRLERWFNFSQNRRRGRDVVLKEDFFEFYERRLAQHSEEADNKDVASKNPSTNAKTNKDTAVERPKRIERQNDSWNALRNESSYGSHAMALNAIIERGNSMAAPKPAITRTCGYCDGLVIEQFLECMCSDEKDLQRQWYVCNSCLMIKHDDTRRGPCYCDVGDKK